MRKLVPILGLLLMALQLAAQAPDWYNAVSRKMLYPSEAYYTGYVEGSKQSGETLENALSRLKDAARGELASTIRTSVKQTIDSRTQSNMQQSGSSFDEQIQETFISETRISSSIKDIPGLKVEAYQNPKNGEICAFAFVKRSTLITYLVKQIALLSGKAENDLEQAKEMIGNGQKNQARSVVMRGLRNLAQAEEAQNLLFVIDEMADEETLQIKQTRSLNRQLTALHEQLRNVLSVYVQCDAKLFGSDYTALKGEVERVLSEAELSFVTYPEEADWAIYIRAEAQEHAKTDFGNMSNYAAFVEAHIDIDRKSNGKRVYSSGLTSNISNHTRGFDAAAQDAYKKITPMIIEILTKQLGLEQEVQ